ncbi:iron-sulfur cluster carrier protein MrpORP [Desulfolutivibrio sulfoxidireducens]|uniref:iron-sulfur cluster carrier protein MrpORP n=1 Tax=Desulfolutivibrio sulfoxidireducens TaxID=2773299 RepID=UPI00159DCA6B|nr:iron-sulfur cluster carrier protein MrpORP [Desulfolutivibrio sulfoxidireducens]QLA19073.1 P-loop NTPase [Desulfolutivibrio sulfoxidireducens]
MSDQACASCADKGKCDEDKRLNQALCRIKRKIVVLSGKGGVGKSTVAANLAAGLALEGKKVGLLDVDVHGPSIPRLLKLTGIQPGLEGDMMLPVEWNWNLKVMSLGFLLPDSDEAVIWRGPVKGGVIKQFLENVAWGDLDYLVVDCPPGTGDEPLSVMQLLGTKAQALIVTSPQAVALDDVRRSVTFCRRLDNPVLGIVENMSGFVCPDCGATHNIFSTGGGEVLAKDMGVPFLGRIPIDPSVASAGDAGEAFLAIKGQSPSALAFKDVVAKVMAMAPADQADAPAPAAPATDRPAPGGESSKLTVAVPTAGGTLCAHFGHCETFAVMDVDTATGTILATRHETPPPHEPGVIPAWIADLGVDVVIAGGMGQKARDLFEEKGVKVVVGAMAAAPEAIVADYLRGSLTTGPNTCDH